MSRYIDLIFTAPPAMSAPQYVQSQDEAGNELAEIGQWLAPDDAVPFWRLRYDVAGLLALLVSGTALPAIAEGTPRYVRREPELQDNVLQGESLAQRKRRELKEKIRDAAPRYAPGSVVPDEPVKLTAAELAGAVEADDELAAAQAAEPEDGGFDPSAVDTDDSPRLAAARRRADKLEGSTANPLAERLFDGKFHGKTGDSAADEDDEG